MSNICRLFEPVAFGDGKKELRKSDGASFAAARHMSGTETDQRDDRIKPSRGMCIMSKRHSTDRFPSPGADEMLYCERCGISFLWTREEQTYALATYGSAETGNHSATVPRPQFCRACRRLLPAPARERGLVKWYSHEKRYGFVVRANQPDLFVHHAEIQPGVRLRPGDLVEFSVAENERGPAATQVALLQRAGAAS